MNRVFLKLHNSNRIIILNSNQQVFCN